MTPYARAEITDAEQALEKAHCIMLNAGRFVPAALKLLEKLAGRA